MPAPRASTPGSRPTGRAWLPRASSVPVALAVALVALATLMAYTVWREATVRTAVIVDAHRGVAELVAARLATELVQADRAIDSALDNAAPTDLAGALLRIERDRPWLSPLVIVSGGATPALGTEGPRGNPSSTAFDEAFARAEEQELAARDFAAAFAGYSHAATLAH
jgi:hypothetical protein